MPKVTLVFPYIGKLNEFHIFALNQLSNVNSARILLIVKSDDKLLINGLKKNVQVVSIEDVFNFQNKLDIKLDDIIQFPYKLCDYKPFFNLIFQFDFDEYWGFGDLDCIYNAKKVEKIFSSLKDQNGVYGRLGHFTIFGKDTVSPIQNMFFDVLEYYKNAGVNLMDPRKGYALDEHRFLNVICSDLHKANVIHWYSEMFHPLWDVDYKNIIPKNIIHENLVFDVNGIYNDNGDISDLSYIHLQKRKLFSNENLYDHMLSIKFCDINGCVSFIRDRSFPKYSPSLKNRSKFYIKVFFKRLKYRINNYGIGKRPSLKNKQ